MDLSGTWRAALADDDLRREAVQPEYDDDGWEPIAGPRSLAVGAGLRRRATARSSTAPASTSSAARDERPALAGPRRALLPGRRVARRCLPRRPRGLLLPPRLRHHRPGRPVVRALAVRRGHVHTRSATGPPSATSPASSSTGTASTPTGTPGGLWRPVRVERTGPVRIAELRVRVPRGRRRPGRAAAARRARHRPTPARCGCAPSSTTGWSGSFAHGLATGRQRGHLAVRRRQPRAVVAVVARRRSRSPTSPSRSSPTTCSATPRGVRTGLRQVGLRHWIFTVNGERLFVKGANLAPTRRELAEATPDELRRDVVLAREAGLDLVRVHAHVSRPELYDAADELGMLVWQDFPLQWGYARSIRHQATRQAREMVEPARPPPVDRGLVRPQRAARASMSRPASRSTRPTSGATPWGRCCPTWNRSVLDLRVKRAIERADGSRPVIPHSGVAAAPAPARRHRQPPLLRVVLGRRARPARLRRHRAPDGAVRERVRRPGRARVGRRSWSRSGGRTSTGQRLARHHALQKCGLRRPHPAAPTSRPSTAWREATQEYQATRGAAPRRGAPAAQVPPDGRLRHVPAQRLPARRHAGASSTTIGRPRPAYHALVEACRPVIVVADRLPAVLQPGDALGLDVHVVSDLRRELHDAEVTAHLAWPGGGHRWRWRGDDRHRQRARASACSASWCPT